MNKLFSLIVMMCCVYCGVLAQNIGHTTITFNDPTRLGGFGTGGGAGRQIQTEIYYNAVLTGEDVALQLVSGKGASLIVFGHGFLMAWDSYSWLWDSLVREGFVVALPRTEGGIAPNHQDFGADLKIVAVQLSALNSNTASLFYNKLNNFVALGGHSMGGGASFIAAGGNANVHCLFTLAPAQTINSSASAGAKLVQVPTLVMAGSNDCVAPPAQHAKLIYDSINELTCRWYINLNDGLHCQFNDVNTICNAGQIGCSTSPLSREQQHIKTLRHLRPFLNYFVGQNGAELSNFLSAYSLAADAVKEGQCVTASVAQNTQNINILYPNPCNTYFVSPSTGVLSLFTLQGQLLRQRGVVQQQKVDTKNLAAGVYQVQVGNTTYKLLVQ